MKEKLEKMLKKYEIDAKFQKINEFLLFYNELLEWNKKFNLTKIVNEDEVIVKHFLDSVYPHSFLPMNSNVLDIGAGAGFRRGEGTQGLSRRSREGRRPEGS